MKCNQFRPGFELASPCPIPATITITPRTPPSGSVMVFGMFSSQGTTPLVRLQTRVNAQIYKNIVQDHIVPIIQNSGFDRATYMQDNAPCHMAKMVMSYLSKQDFEIMDWPPQSPDLNPSENLWKTLGVKVIERNPTN